MRWVGWPAFLGALCVLAIPVALAGFGNPDPCDYDPVCTEFGSAGAGTCDTCQKPKYDTACYGGCNYSSYTCVDFGNCEYPDSRTISSGCPTGYVKDQICPQATCEWTDSTSCYLDASGDYDGDGVSNSLDDCAFVYASPPTHCNGCPNPTCAGCLTWPASCPASGGRLCTEGDDSQCASHQCVDGCVGNNWCSFDGEPFCDEFYATCECPAATCTYSATCDTDDDDDGVPDVSDACAGTPSGEVVGTDGCSCSQKTCDDSNECTSDFCSASAQCIFTNRAPGTSCDAGEGACDGNGNCVAVTWCSATPGCLATQPAGSHVVTGECTKPEETCFACNADTTWNGLGCASDACTPACSPGSTQCDGNAFQTCQSNGCWQTTTTCTGTTPACSVNGCVCNAISCPSGQQCQNDVCTAVTCNPACAAEETCDDGTCVCVFTSASGYCDAQSYDCGRWLCGQDSWQCGTCTGGRSCASGGCECPVGSSWDGSSCVPDCVVTTETCNGIDDDCDTIPDPDDPDACTDGYCLHENAWACVECRPGMGDCGPGQTCTDYTCVATPYVLTADPGNILQQEGHVISTVISIVPERDCALEVTGFDLDPPGGDPPFTVEGVSYAPGEWDLRLAAHDTLGRVLAELVVPIAITCHPNKACCTPGDTQYWPVNTKCTYDGDPNGGVCDQDGLCVENCISTMDEACDGNELWTLNSCGNLDRLVEDCALSGQECTEDSVPACRDPPQSCTDEYEYLCRDGNVYRRDLGCFVTVLHDDCQSNERCENAVCVRKAFCDDAPGTMRCGDDCIDPLTDRLNCGGCDRECGRNEQCIQGMCALISGCVVVCDNSADCGPDQVCLNAGDCSISRCQPIDVLDQEPGVVEALSELLVEDLVQVNTTIVGDTFHYTVRNLAGTTLENVTITTEYKKLIASSANDLRIQGVDYTIIEEDPVIAFELTALGDQAAFTVTVPRQLQESDLGLATILGITYNDLFGLWNDTKDALTIGLNSEFDGENTRFHLTLNPNKALEGLSIPIEIPKCMAEYAKDMELVGDFRVVKDDPLIVWQFDTLDKATDITFSVPGDIDEECKAQLKAMAIADRVGKPLNPWLAILIAPIIGFVLIFFQRFGPRMRRREVIAKEEYFGIGRKRGMSEADLEREWHKYKKGL